MESISCGFCQYCRSVDLGSIQCRGGVVEFFLTFEFNYTIIRIQLCRCVERKPKLVAAISSSSEDDVSLGASQEEAPTPPTSSTDAASSSRVHSAEVACLRSGISSPASTRHSGRTTFQCKFVKVLVFSFKL